MTRTGADVVAFFAAFDSDISRWMNRASPVERAFVVHELDVALSAATVDALDERVEQLSVGPGAPPGASERSVAAIRRMLRFERERLYGAALAQ